MSTIVAGNDTVLSVTCLTALGVADSFAAATSVKLAIGTVDRRQLLLGPFTLLSGSPANWAAGLVACPLTAAQTATLKAAEVAVEVQVKLAGVTTSYLSTANVTVVPGLVGA